MTRRVARRPAGRAREAPKTPDDDGEALRADRGAAPGRRPLVRFYGRNGELRLPPSLRPALGPAITAVVVALALLAGQASTAPPERVPDAPTAGAGLATTAPDEPVGVDQARVIVHVQRTLRKLPP